MRNPLARLCPPTAPQPRSQALDPLQNLLDASGDCDAAVLGLIVCLERRHAAVTAALAAGAVSAPLGKRMMTRGSVERALAASGMTRFAGAHRPASSRRVGFLGQALQATRKPEKGE